ncbi:MAG: hypothetical protein HC866_14240 [Leptolyngbyaceae cyanobacterium RU_5_1]|nr:hypothetical protein [Leptolyngbyaceae cyanobacterium RU_5_1]
MLVVGCWNVRSLPKRWYRQRADSCWVAIEIAIGVNRQLLLLKYRTLNSFSSSDYDDIGIETTFWSRTR